MVALFRLIFLRAGHDRYRAQRGEVFSTLGKGFASVDGALRQKKSVFWQRMFYFFVFFSSQIFAWNANGHRLIAQMTYDQLTPQAKQVYHAYNRAVNVAFHQRKSFVEAAVWLDELYPNMLAPLRPMHYLDIPFSDSKRVLPQSNPINAVWAIRMALHRLQQSSASKLEKGMAFRILLHVVGDLHQPLHAATRVSGRYPLGDRGGNLVRLPREPVARTLHAYWDRGGGILIGRFHASDVKTMAKALEKRYPCTPFSGDPMQWALDSHTLAKNVVYAFLPAQSLPASYQTMAQNLTQQRMALASCRLATLLNNAVLQEAHDDQIG